MTQDPAGLFEPVPPQAEVAGLVTAPVSGAALNSANLARATCQADSRTFFADGWQSSSVGSVAAWQYCSRSVYA